MTELDGSRDDQKMHKKVLGPQIDVYETQRMHESATYDFWLTASTKVGEGEKSQIVRVQPNNKVPARIISFSQTIISPWKGSLVLPCRKVGSPLPVTIWRQDGQAMETNNRKTIAKNGTLLIRDCMNSDEANYTCSVENTWGKDEIVYNVIIRVPPDAPVLTVVNAYADSLHLEWMDNKNGGSAILGYVINFKRETGDWEELQIDSKTNSHSLMNLWCGTKYQLYITAYNKIGTGLPCDIVNTQTKGNVPLQPKHSQMITHNSTSVTCWLDSWGDGGCGISHFVVECKPYARSQWTMISAHIAPTERVFTVTDLHPGIKYQLRVTAYNNAGFTNAIYDFTTSAATGSTCILCGIHFVLLFTIFVNFRSHQCRSRIAFGWRRAVFCQLQSIGASASVVHCHRQFHWHRHFDSQTKISESNSTCIDVDIRISIDDKFAGQTESGATVSGGTLPE